MLNESERRMKKTPLNQGNGLNMHSLIYLMFFLFMVGCSPLSYRMTHGGSSSQERAVAEYQTLSPIEQATIQQELVEIAKKGSTVKIRTTALALLDDAHPLKQAYFADLAKKETSLEETQGAIEKLTDQALLLEVAKNARSPETCIIAMGKVVDPKVIAAFAQEHRFLVVSQAAVEQLKDQTLLEAIAQTSASVDVRERAVRKLTSQTVLEKVASTDESWRIRALAVDLLQDEALVQRLLAEIAKHAWEMDIRQAAVEKLTDQTHLVEVAKTAEHPFAREVAIRKILDQKVLAEIVQTDRVFYVREVALKHLTNQVLLAEIVDKNKDLDLRKMAVHKLTDQDKLVTIAQTNKDCEIRQIAVRKLSLETCRAHIDECLMRSKQVKMAAEDLVVEDLYIGMPLFDFVVITTVKEIPTIYTTIDHLGRIDFMLFTVRQWQTLTQLEQKDFCQTFLKKYAGVENAKWQDTQVNGALWKTWRNLKLGIKISYCVEDGTLGIEAD